MRAFTTLRLAIPALLLWSCGGTELAAVKDTPTAEETISDLVLVDAAVDVPDLRNEPDEWQLDGPPTGPDADTVESGCEPGAGCFLDKCSENSDCLSGWCVDHMGESVCTVACMNECPPGWSCQQVAGSFPDLEYVCVSDYTNLCRPCATGNDCKSPVGAEDVCVAYGPEGSFCGGACSPGADTDCPWGFSCQEAQTVDGITTWQCVADAGVCPCTGKSVELSLWTACTVTNEWGACEGKRVCGPEGLSPCDAPAPAEEICNGLDDDCDGLVDEPTEVQGAFVDLCNDDNPCTEDACFADEGCTHTPVSGAECIDGDICTTADHCEDGVCVGSPVICDDKNECTDDVCTPQGGCDYVPNAVACDDSDPCTVADQCSDGACTGVAISCECNSDPDCAALDDDDLCTGVLYCDTDSLPHLCKVKPGTPVVCPEPEGPEGICLQAACNPATGACSYVPDHEGFACSSGDKCVVGQTCEEGACVGGIELNCEDNNPCTADACEPATGCVHDPVPGACNDGNVCTAGDTCQVGACVPGEPLDCTDANPCTADTCDPQVGCVHTPTIAPDAHCCKVPADCPPEYSAPATCNEQSTCQGSIKTAICVENQCGASVVQDDSACVGLADACGLYKDIVCSGEAQQTAQACPAFCLSDDDCDPYTHCDGVCVADFPIGHACVADGECETSNCNAAPAGLTAFCNAPMHECALDDGTGVNEGFKYCYQGDVWLCAGNDAWSVVECEDDCGFYLPVDGCDAAKCAVCPAFCTSDDDCDANAHCDGECVADLPLAAACDEDSDCVSGNCGAAPGGDDFCIPLTDECALDSGEGVDTGFALCRDNDRWYCGPDDLWISEDCADECGLFVAVDACADGTCAACPQSCVQDAECDDSAHCDGVCAADLADGDVCDEHSDCATDHCQNGFCCTGGDCCQVPLDCPGKYMVAPLCDDAAACQGHRVDRACIDNACASQMVDDDSACGGDTLAHDCGLFVALYCTGEQDQDLPACPESCATDEECDPQAHCDDGTCVADLDWGSQCDEDSDCAGSLCHQGKCCKQACTTDGCSTGVCGDDGECTIYTDGQHNCDPCHACDADGQCQPQTADGAAASALGCQQGDEGCRRCTAGTCDVYTAGQHGCSANHSCDAQGTCHQDLPQYEVVCFGGYPQHAWVSSYCPAGYHHLYHVCGASSINSYSWGPHYQDKYLESGGHCSCCCNCNSVCVKCELD